MAIAPIITAQAPDAAFIGSVETFWNDDPRNLTAAAGGSLIRGSLPVGINHIPAGHIPVLCQQGTTTPVAGTLQLDKPSTFTDTNGNVSTIWQTFRLYTPEQIVPGSSKKYSWNVVAGTRPTTPVVTTAQIIANTNIMLKCHGGDFGSDTFTVSLNDILQNFTGGMAPQNWGTNPFGGWEWTESGPVVCSLNAWRYLRRDSDGAQHSWVRVDFYWSFLACASGNVASYGTVVVSHPNIKGPHPTGTVGGSSLPICFRGIFEIWNGSSQFITSDFVGAYGGSLDPLTRSVAATSLTAANNVLSGMGLQGYAHAFQVTSTGTVPGGMTSGGIYFWTGENFHNSRNDMVDGTNPIAITSAGTGTITFTAMATVASGCKFVMRTTDGQQEPLWLGTNARPAIVRRTPDLNYLYRGARIVAPRDPSIVISTYPSDLSTASLNYNDPAPGPIVWSIETTGDGQQDVRIGEVNVIDCVRLHMASSRAVAVISQSQMYGSADYQSHYVDETSGRRTVGTNKQYTGLGVARPNMNYLQGEGYDGFIGTRSNGYIFNYAVAVDGSHMPVFAKIPLLLTGDDIALESLFDQTGSIVMGYNRHGTGPTGNTFYSAVITTSDQARAPGWALWLMSFTRKVAPDQHLETQHYRDCYKNAANFMNDCAQNNSTALKNIGITIGQMPQRIIFNQNVFAQAYMFLIWDYAVCGAVWMGLEQGFTQAVTSVGYIWICNRHLPEYGGQMYVAGVAQMQWTTDGTTPHASLAAMWLDSYNETTNQPLTANDTWSGPNGMACQSENNLFIWGGDQGSSPATDWSGFIPMMMEMADIAGIPNCRPMLTRLRARMNRNGGFNPAPYLQGAVKSWNI